MCAVDECFPLPLPMRYQSIHPKSIQKGLVGKRALGLRVLGETP
jgi:hypothetical protein